MSEPTEYDVLEAMQTYGGSFAQALGRCYRAADAINAAKLQAAFPDYFIRYRRMAALHIARRANAPAAVDLAEADSVDLTPREKGI